MLSPISRGNGVLYTLEMKVYKMFTIRQAVFSDLPCHHSPVLVGCFEQKYLSQFIAVRNVRFGRTANQYDRLTFGVFQGTIFVSAIMVIRD
jgi:hypothetical protein